MTALPLKYLVAAHWKLGASDALRGGPWQGLNDDQLAGWRWVKQGKSIPKALNAYLRKKQLEPMHAVKVSAPQSETFAEVVAEISDPAEWAALQLTKVATPGMTVGDAMERIKAIVNRAIEIHDLNRSNV